MTDWTAFWKDYRRNTGTLNWRLATGADVPAIRRLRNVSERFLHQKQRNPSLFNLPVLLALVAENKDGKIVDCLYVEAQVELVKMACTSKGLDESAGLAEDLASWLRGIGYRTVLASTPPTLKERMSWVLRKLGFHAQDEELSYWKLRL